MDDRDLIPHDDSIARNGLRRVAAWVSVVLFVGVLAGTGVVDLVWPAERPQLQGKEREAEHRAQRRARISDGSLARWIERDLRVRSRVRRVVLPDYSFLLYFYLGEGTDEAVIGSDGFVFIEQRVLIGNKPRPQVFARISRVFAALERRLASAGIQLVILVIPRKSVVEEEHLPRGYDPQANIYTELVADLTLQGFVAPDILAAYQSKSGENFYRLADSHWNDKGKLVAAEEVARKAGLLVPNDQRFGTVMDIGAETKNRDTFRFMGIDPKPWQEAMLLDESVRKFRLMNSEGRSMPPLQRFSDEMGRIALVGTSFSARTSFPDFLSHFVGEKIWFGAMEGAGPEHPMRRSLLEMVRLGSPEVLVWEIPGHSLVSSRWVDRKGGPLPDVGGVFAVAPFGRVKELARFPLEKPGAAGVGRRQLVTGVQQITTKPSVAMIQATDAFFAGDGSVSVRFEGQVKGGPVKVEVRSGAETLVSEWEPGIEQVLLPVLAPGLVGEVSVEVSCDRCEAELTLSRVDLVSDLVVEKLEKVKAESLESVGAGWTQTATLSESKKVGRYELVRVRMDDLSGWDEGSIDVRLVLEDGREVGQRASRLGGLGNFQAFFPGRDVGDAVVTGVKISGHGSERALGVVQVSFLSPEWPSGSPADGRDLKVAAPR